MMTTSEQRLNNNLCTTTFAQQQQYTTTISKLRNQDRRQIQNQHQTPLAPPTAFNPQYSASIMMMSQSNDTTSPSRSSSLSSLDRETSTTSSVSAPIEIQCVDPVIASIFQPGFASNYDHEDHINNSEHDHHIWLHQGEKENGLPDNIEYVIMDEPGEEIPTITRKRSRVSFLHRPHLATNAKNCHHPTSTTDTSPKVVQLSEHGTHYGKAQILAWRTQRASKAALRKALQLPKKHSPRAKAVALKSVEVVKEVSIKSVELALKHSPINCHHNNNNNSSNNNNSNKTKL